MIPKYFSFKSASIYPMFFMDRARQRIGIYYRIGYTALLSPYLYNNRYDLIYYEPEFQACPVYENNLNIFDINKDFIPSWWLAI
jgi:hypothetical protein